MDCQDIVFSQKQSQKRIDKALRILPSQMLKKFLFFALYLLDARLNAIASLVEMPEKSEKTTISRVMKDGIPAFHDRRQSAKINGLHIPTPQKPRASVLIEEDYCTITFGNMEHQLKMAMFALNVEIYSIVLIFLIYYQKRGGLHGNQ